jgi:hypothetical protein
MSQRDLRFTADISLKASAGKAPRVSIVAYTGGPMSVGGMGPVVIDLSALEMPNQIPLLIDHENAVAAVAGTGVPEIRGGKLLVRGTLTNTESGKQVLSLLQEGIGLQASVGIRVKKTKYLRAGESVRVNGRTIEAPGDGLGLVTAGKLQETSLVVLGADDQTSVSIAAKKGHTMKTRIPKAGLGSNINGHDFRDYILAAGFDPSDLEDNQRDFLLKQYQAQETGATSPADRLRAKQDRQQGIRELTQEFSARMPDKQGIVQALEATAIAEDWTPERLSLELYREEKTHYGIDNTLRPSRPAVTADTIRAAALLHAGMATAAEKAYGAQVCQRAHDLRVRSIIDLAERILQARGQEVPLGKDEIIRTASMPMLQAAGPSTISLPVALGNIAEKSLLSAYNTPVKTWMSWVARRPVRNFKDHTSLRPLSTRTLERVAAGGELKHGSVGEDTYTHSADTWGRLILLDRRDIINDDLQALLEVPRELGLEGARTLADEIYKCLLDNTSSFFGAGNGNYDSGAGTALSADSLETAISLFRKQVDSAGRVMDLPPVTLLVSPENEWTAKRLINSSQVERSQSSADKEPTGNALKDLLRVEVEPRLSTTGFHANISTTGWYLFGNPNIVPVLIASFLEGRENPVIEAVDVPSNYLGSGWRVVFDFGTHLADYRAGVLMAGA